ncbi:MAG: N-acetylglucosamine-6-phosphate deacetylase [Acidobacteria bacterium]|nr:N-acetylglucosamine-6-phosphate deacetylase [Acidobacteriota bacterium]
MSLLAISARQVFTPLEAIEDGLVVIEEGTIRSVGSRQELTVPSGARFLDLGDRILVPGFVDVHIHGGLGRDLMEGTAEALETVARLCVQHGTTSFLPTTLTAPVPALRRVMEGLGIAIRSWKKGAASSGEPSAEPLGIHMEGPFLNEGRRGVHPPEFLQKPSLPLLRQLTEAAGGSLKILTLAPELEGAPDVQAAAQQSGVQVALGHSDATFEEAQRAIDAGARHAVHVFNAMRPFAHRDPGILGAVLTDDRVFAEVIADGAHVAAPALRLLVQAKGVQNVLLVTDGVSATGMCPGHYRLGGLEIVLGDDPRTGLLSCRNSEGKLAGSVLTQDRAIRNMVSHAHVMLREAVTMVTWNPARLLGLETRKGCLRPGADADLVVLEPNGTVAGTMVSGFGSLS